MNNNIFNNQSIYNKVSGCYKHIEICLALGVFILIILSFSPEMVLAAKFDIDAGVKAGADPIMKAIDNHWGKFVAIVGCSAAVLGEGDGRQRATRAAIGAGLAGAVILGLLATLT